MHFIQANNTRQDKLTILLEDFNLDWSKRFNNNYPYKNYHNDIEGTLGNLGLNQMVDFPKWLC